MAHQALTECTKVHAATAHSNMVSGAQQLIRSAAFSQSSLQNQQQWLEQQMTLPVGSPCTECGWQTKSSTPPVLRKVTVLDHCVRG